MKKHTAINEIARGAIIAAIYALLTIFLAPISSGLIQCRVAEALCVLPYYTFSAVPGLFIGCVIANLITGAPIWDVMFGSLATLLAAYTTYAMRRRVTKFLAPLPAVLYNAVIVGALLVYVYAVPVTYPVAALYVAAGQAVACFGLGVPLLLALGRVSDKIF